MSFQAEAVVDLDTIAGNVATLVGRTDAEVLTAVKGNGYGHGMVPAAQACLAGGASWLGVATLAEAMALRAAGVTAPVLAWLVAPGQDLAAAIDSGVDLAATSMAQLSELLAVSARRPARVHLKADTGMGRGGAPRADWEQLCELAAKGQADGRIDVVGAWSHLACADEPEHPANAAQRAAFTDFLTAVAAAGLTPRWRHLANSAALLSDPGTHYDLVRPGIAAYGYPPVPGDFGLRPALRLRAQLVLVKRLPAGHGIGYGHTFIAGRPTTVAVVALGYADGIPRAVSNRGQVTVAGRRRPILGRISMDQFTIDVGDDGVRPGDVAELFGPDDLTAEDWAGWNDTISYEILTSIGSRVPRRYLKAGI
jgi:alanine racemase